MSSEVFTKRTPTGAAGVHHGESLAGLEPDNKDSTNFQIPQNILTDPDRLDPWAELPPLRTWCLIGDRPAIPRAGIVAVAARKKQGKSYFLYALSIALLRGEKFGSVMPLEMPRRVILFDTEMSNEDLQLRTRAVLRSAGKDAPFYVFPILNVNREKRLSFIAEKINLYAPDIAIIDGVADLIADFNDVKQSTDIMEMLLRLAKDRTLFCVIHLNKLNEELRGHLGTCLGNKATEVYSTKKSGGIFTVTCTDSRFSDTEDAEKFCFAIGRDGEITADAVTSMAEAKKRMELQNLFAGIFGDEAELSYTELLSGLKERGAKTDSAAKKKVGEALSFGVVSKINNERGAPYSLVSF
jgi:hypothetical protein